MTRRKVDKLCKKCSFCKKDIFMYPSNIRINQQHFFCNRSCKALWQKINLCGSQNPFFGKTHKDYALEHIKTSWFKKGQKSINNGKTFVIVTCNACKKTFFINIKNYNKNKKKFFCNRKCWSSQKIKTMCLYCEKQILKPRCYISHKIGNFCSNDCMKKFKKEFPWNIGDLNPAWKGGISFEPYTIDFNKRFKAFIRERDNHVCLLCYKSEKALNYNLHIHHIDYDKLNSFPQNCISLCKKCHACTCFNRDKWQVFFKSLLNERYNYTYSTEQKEIENFITEK